MVEGTDVVRTISGFLWGDDGVSVFAEVFSARRGLGVWIAASCTALGVSSPSTRRKEVVSTGGAGKSRWVNEAEWFEEARWFEGIRESFDRERAMMDDD